MIAFVMTHWRLAAVAVLLIGAYWAGYTRADNAAQARMSRALTQAQTEFDERLAQAIEGQASERERQRRIADVQLRRSEERAATYRELSRRAADRPVPDCAVSGDWVRDIGRAFAGGSQGADGKTSTAGIAAGAVPGVAGSTGQEATDVQASTATADRHRRAVSRLQGTASGASGGRD